MTFVELAMRLQRDPEDARALEVLDAHSITTDGAGIHCRCGWTFTVEQWCRRDEFRSFAEVIRDHVEPELAKARAA